MGENAMAGPEFFQTRMGQIFYEHTMPNIAAHLGTIAAIMERQQKPASVDWDVVMTKESILHNASEDELFALFHTFKEYLTEHLQGDPTFSAGIKHVIDRDIGEIIKKLKANYK